MKYQILTILFLGLSFLSFSQDTTWVQTFNFDSISTRRANFVFPQELETKRFEKVLMYYKLKCDASTPWDQYSCGEWDYLAYTRIFDHTGENDSLQVDSVQYLNNFANSGQYNYVDYGTIQDQRMHKESVMSPYVTTLNNMIMPQTGTSNRPFNVTSNGSRMQILLTAAELTAGGVTSGDLQSLALTVQNITVNGAILHPVISIKSTSLNALTTFEKTGFTKVYDRSRSTGLGNELVIGQNEFLFHQPFSWNGTDNIIIEFLYESSIVALNDIQFGTETTAGNMALSYDNRNGVLSLNGTNQAMLELSDYDFGGAITVAFWAKGNSSGSLETFFIEGVDTLNNRAFNVHLPWGDGKIYFDCGEGESFDRIDKTMTGNEVDNVWHHWAFIKDQSTGTMKVMKDGVLWNSGTGLTRNIGEIHRFILGASSSLGNNWKGQIDEFQVYNSALDQATVSAWLNKRITASHPNWSDLLCYYTFDDKEFAEDMSSNDYLLMPSSYGMFDFSAYPVAGVETVNRPVIAIGTGGTPGAVTIEYETYYTLKEPEVIFEFAVVDRHTEIVDAFLAVPEGDVFTYNENNIVTSSVPFSGAYSLMNQTITYYETPFEIINDVEIGRFITPYGINFNLTANGQNGFTWIYDVTDYQMYLKDTVDLAAHNTQELIDLKFAFIEGIPPRDVHKREPIWSEWDSYLYKNLDNDFSLSAVQIPLSDTSEMFKINTRITGHGQVGNTACCEWKKNDHKLLIDGVQRFNWNIFRESACGDNPNTGQGGTWPYAREGWCPGDLVEVYGHEITPFVTPGQNVMIDYDISPVNSSDPVEGNGNYVMAMDLISYSAPNFQNDAAIVDILNPNNYEYYRKWNPSCSTPRVIIQNTGALPLTSCVIRISLSATDFIDYNWTGSLDFLEKEIVEIPVNDIYWWQTSGGVNQFTAEIRNVQGSNLDEYSNNNKKTVKYNAPEFIPGPFIVWFNTNNKAYENKWRLEDEAGTVIFERTSLINNTDYKDTFDLQPGCYSLIIEDSDSDGLGYWYSNQYQGETNGSFRVKTVGGPVIESFPRDFGNYHRYNFTVGVTLGLDEKSLNRDINVYPNPNDGIFYIEMEGDLGNNAQVQVIDLMGRVITTKKMNTSEKYSNAKIEMENTPSGQYILKIQTNDSVYTKNFVKK